MTITAWNFLEGGFATGANTLFDFATLKNYVFATDYANSKPLCWNGITTSGMAQGYRLSWGYTAKGNELTFTVDGTDNSILNMTTATQSASGLYPGKLLYISGGALGHGEIAAIDAFVTTGTAGDTNYYVTQITLTSTVKADRTTANYNGVTITSTASGGSITTSGALTCFKIMGITQMKSGGYRASEEISIDVKDGTSGQIQISDLLMNATFTGAQFGFDIPSSATTWFMTKAFNPTLKPSEPLSAATQVYYKIPAPSLSTSVNPMLNSETAFDINTQVAGTEHTTLNEYNLEQAYFTEQVDAPKVKYMRVFNNFMCEAGDPCFPSRLWISELLSPQIWSEFGGTQGSFLDINPDDGDEIVGIKPWSTFLFIFKNHGVFRMSFTANADTPFEIQKVSGSVGALSHFAIQETDGGLVFLTEKGPAICKGYYVTYTAFGGPQDSISGLGGVDPLFDANYSAPLNFDALKYSVSGNDTQHKRLWFSVTQGTDSTYRDKALIYDYAHNQWWLNNNIANYYASIADTNNFISVWSGNYIAQVYQQEAGFSDEPGIPIDFSYTMPPVYSGDTFGWMNVRRLWISGIPSTGGSSTLTVTATSLPAGDVRTLTFDMTNSELPYGIYQPLQGDCKALQIQLTHSDNVPLNITGIRLDYEPNGDRV